MRVFYTRFFMLSFQNQVYILCWERATFRVLQQARGLWACEGARVPLLGGAGSWGIAGKDLLSWEFADLHSPPRPSRQPLLFLVAAPGAALREASPSPGGALSWSEGA